MPTRNPMENFSDYFISLFITLWKVEESKPFWNVKLQCLVHFRLFLSPFEDLWRGWHIWHSLRTWSVASRRTRSTNPSRGQNFWNKYASWVLNFKMWKYFSHSAMTLDIWESQVNVSFAEQRPSSLIILMDSPVGWSPMHCMTSV